MIPSVDYEKLLLNGWDIHQWAVAIERVGLGWTQMKYADKCQKEYLSKFGQNPLEFQLIGVSVGGDYDLAMAPFEQTQHKLESVDDKVELDSSYQDHTKDDMEYNEAFKIRMG